MRTSTTPPSPESRAQVLEQSRQRKMARSAHAYVRGNTLKFYEWLAQGSGDHLPAGPAVWICGDCHVGNLGPVASSEGKIEIEIRDLDQTVFGNPAHDLIRLGLSLATAARGSDLPGVTTAHMIERMVVGYEHALAAPKAAGKVRADGGPVEEILQQAMRRRWHHLAEERIEDVTPTIPLGRNFWALAPREREAIDELFRSAEAATLLASMHGDEKVRVLDAAYWMKGCSSLGRLRFAVLLGIGKKRRQTYSLIDIKEAVKAAAPADPAQQPVEKRDYAHRVVTGARALSPYLGERMVASTLLDRPVVMRELMPQDLKLEMDRLTRDQAVSAAEYLAGIVGRAHARQMDAGTRKSWRTELNKDHGKNLDAPHWLWRSVVDLVASHEAAYLEHCRKFVLA